MWHVGLDLSGAAARLAVQGDGVAAPGLEAIRPMRGRDAAVLADWLMTSLTEWGVAVPEIARWTVGAGPGSFTGMRLAAALVQGITANQPGVATRCVPTAVAIAAAARPQPAAGERLAVIYDGRNQEVLVFGLEARSGGWVAADCAAILNRAQAADWFGGQDFTVLVALQGEWDAIGRIVPEAVMARVTAVAEDFSLLPLLASDRGFNQDLTDLVYLRPAVFAR